MDVKKKDELIQITTWTNPVALIKTQKFGEIQYSLWLKKEKSRVNSDNNRITEIRTNKHNNNIALFANDLITH